MAAASGGANPVGAGATGFVGNAGGTAPMPEQWRAAAAAPAVVAAVPEAGPAATAAMRPTR